jgi:hypothetical protein
MTAAMLLGMASVSLGQAGPGGPGGGGPGGGGPGGGGPGGGGFGQFDPAQFRQFQLDNIRQQLSATDDEWKVLEPKISKILDLQPLAITGGRGGFGRRGGGPGGPGGGGGGGGRGFGGPPNATQEKVQAVSAAVEANAPDTELKAKMATAREARDKARADLAAARKDLIGLLTTKQEAVLFAANIVE